MEDGPRGVPGARVAPPVGEPLGHEAAHVPAPRHGVEGNSALERHINLAFATFPHAELLK